jgi:hypothetical protein
MTLRFSALNFSRLVFSGAALSFFGLAAWLLFGGKTGSGTAAAVVGAMVLCLANMDRIESIKGLGMEAKTRDLRQAIDDAQSTLAKLEAMSDQLKVQADSIEALQSKLDETNTMAQRAQALVFMNT